MGQGTGTGITQVGTVGIPVSDQTQALAFYVDTLGFEKRLDAPFGDGGRWVEVAPPGATTTVALVPPAMNGGTGIDTGVRFHTGDVDGDHQALVSQGVDADPAVLHWPGVPPMFAFRDPDGNTLYIVEGG
jgi:lactoylglutathione lyase